MSDSTGQLQIGTGLLPDQVLTNSPSEGGTISRKNCTPSEGAKGRSGRKTRLQTLWRTWREYSPSEGGMISRENCTPSEGGTISRKNCTPSEGAKGWSGRKTQLQTLWRTWREYSPYEGGTIPRGNCTPSEGAKGREKEDGYLTADSYLKSMSKRPTHSPWAPAWTTTTSRPTRFL